VKNILVAIDFSDMSNSVVAHASRLARATGAKLWVMHAVTDTSFISGADEVPVPWTISDEDLPRHFPSEQGKLSEAVAALQDMGVDAQSLLVSGPAVDRVLTMAKELEAEMIVVGSHGHTALYKLIVGTISEGVLRKAHCPVLVVPSGAKKEEGSQNSHEVSAAKV